MKVKYFISIERRWCCICKLLIGGMYREICPMRLGICFNRLYICESSHLWTVPRQVMFWKILNKSWECPRLPWTSAERACRASPWQRWPPCWCPAPLLGQWQRCCSWRLCCQSSSTTTCWKLSGKKKRESNMPSISKWGNTVIDARRRTSCSLGGYESPWAPGGAIFIPGKINTR